MRHRKHTAKLGRKSEHRNMMLSNLVCSLIKERRVTTTLAKARAARPVAEKMVTLGKKGSIHNRRVAAARLHQEDAVRILFNEIAPLQKERRGGYTRIVKLHRRRGDAAQLAILEWVDTPVEMADTTAEPAAAAKPAASAPASSSAEPKEDSPAAAKADAVGDGDAKSADDTGSENAPAPEKKD